MNREAELMRLSKLPRVWPNMSFENTTPGLIQLCRDWIKSDFEMVEIGCFAGVSTAVFACFAKTVYAIDPWSKCFEQPGYDGVTEEMIKQAEIDFSEIMKLHRNIIRIQQFSPAAAQGFFDISLDAVYIDGDHRDKPFKADIMAWKPKIKPGGLLMGHDGNAVNLKAAGLGWPERMYSETSWVYILP